MYAARRVFAGRASQHLAEAICRHLGEPLGQAEILKFRNDNTFVQILENVRECDVFVVQTSCPPVDENLMELLIMIDALRRASASRITAVLPYYPYVRSDKKDQPRVPITARLVADLLTTAGADRVVTIDLHAPQIQGFFSVPLDHLTATHLFCDYLRAKGLDAPVAVATDSGAAKRALGFARGLGAPLAIMEKHRLGNTDTVEVTAFIGDVRGRQAIIFEDEIASGHTIVGAVDVLRQQGAAEIYVCAPHGLFSEGALDRLATAGISEVITTDTVPHRLAALPALVTELSVAPLLGEAIRRINTGESISDLFRGE
ncbi:MAG: ribose-phosphate pyrophosphokinae [Firmicutes bacterium]|nr:ribose-phosphate pyrophosphokinae [Bacillota bacterium]